MLRKPARQGAIYLARKAKFNRKRRRIKLDFDQLYSLLASDVSLNQIAKLGGVTKRRINAIYEVYFRDLFGMGPLEVIAHAS